MFIDSESIFNKLIIVAMLEAARFTSIIKIHKNPPYDFFITLFSTTEDGEVRNELQADKKILKLSPHLLKVLASIFNLSKEFFDEELEIEAKWVKSRIMQVITNSVWFKYAFIRMVDGTVSKSDHLSNELMTIYLQASNYRNMEIKIPGRRYPKCKLDLDTSNLWNNSANITAITTDSETINTEVNWNIQPDKSEYDLKLDLLRSDILNNEYFKICYDYSYIHDNNSGYYFKLRGDIEVGYFPNIVFNITYEPVTNGLLYESHFYMNEGDHVGIRKDDSGFRYLF